MRHLFTSLSLLVIPLSGLTLHAHAAGLPLGEIKSAETNTAHAYFGKMASSRASVVAEERRLASGSLSEIIGGEAQSFQLWVKLPKSPDNDKGATPEPVQSFAPPIATLSSVSAETPASSIPPSELVFDAGLANVEVKNELAQARMNSQPVMDIEESMAEISEPPVAGTDAVADDSSDLKSPRLEGAAALPIVQSRLEALSYGDVKISFVDDRSNGRANQFYPAVGVSVSMAATNFKAVSDARGEVQLYDLPQPGRFYIRTDDASNTYLPSHMQINSEQRSQKFLLMRRSLFGAYQEVLGLVQHEDRSSLCVTVYGSSGNTPAADVRVAIDEDGDGPYYFNRFGLIDANITSTSGNGRACFFNVPDGLSNIFVSDDAGESLGVVVALNVAGHHSEEVLDLSLRQPIQVTTAASATAFEELSSDTMDQLKRGLVIDGVDLYPMGSENPMVDAQIFGQLESEEPVLFKGGRAYVAAMNSEFEDALFSVDANMGPNDRVLMLSPRGFLQDMAVYANTDYNPVLGSVVLWHRMFSKHSSIQAEVQLFPIMGGEPQTGWVYAEGDIVKSAFFNVPSGMYQVVVKSTNGYWIAADSVVVYDQTTTIMATGSRSTYKP